MIPETHWLTYAWMLRNVLISSDDVGLVTADTSCYLDQGAFMARHVVSAFKPHMDGLAKLFGTLEADIIDLIWDYTVLSGRDVFEHLRDQGQRISYGAVRTVLDRLVEKQVLIRDLNGNQYTFRATRSREEFTTSAVGEIIDSLFSSFGEPVYAQFLSRIEAEGPEQLQRLAQLITDAELRAANNA